MFTGIIQNKGKVKKTSEAARIKTVFVEASFAKDLKEGESVSIDGICSTVLSQSDTDFSVGYMPETLSKTTAEHFVADMDVNLERSLKVGDDLSGHFVYGHVDTIGVILKIIPDGYSRTFEIACGTEFMKYLVDKGSVTLSGVSLTVSKLKKQSFEVSLIPYTLEHTTLGTKKAGESVNIEFDILGKYVLKGTKSNAKETKREKNK